MMSLQSEKTATQGTFIPVAQSTLSAPPSQSDTELMENTISPRQSHKREREEDSRSGHDIEEFPEKKSKAGAAPQFRPKTATEQYEQGLPPFLRITPETETFYIPHEQLIADGIAITDEDRLFGEDGTPKPEDVRQRYIEDCYLMGALISIAKANPQAVKNCFMEPDSDEEAKKVYKIRLFKIKSYLKSSGKKVCEPIAPVIIKVDKFLSPLQKKTKALWPNILELAYATFLRGGNELEEISLIMGLSRFIPVDLTGKEKFEQILDSGYGFVATAAITGQICTQTFAFQRCPTKKFSEKIGKYNPLSKWVYKKINDLLAACKAVMVAFNEIKEKHESRGVYDLHVYSIMRTLNIGDYSYIVIRNPNLQLMPEGSPGEHYYGNKKFTDRLGANPETFFADYKQLLSQEKPGTIIMELNDFMRRRPELDYQKLN